MSAAASRFDLDGLGGRHWTAVALAVLTGVIHLYVGTTAFRLPLVLAGLGFLGGVGAFLAGYRGRRLYLAAIAFTAVQVVVWTVVNAGEYTAIGYVDKAVQLVLLVVLFGLARRS